MQEAQLTGPEPETTESSWSLTNYIKSWHIFVLITNAMLGLILFEWAWIKMNGYRIAPKQLPELNERMAVFRRRDAETWRKWKFYPGALTVLLPRILLLGIFGVLLLTILSIGLIGYDKSKPMTGCRRWVVRSTYVFWAHTFSSIIFWTCCRYKYITD